MDDGWMQLLLSIGLVKGHVVQKSILKNKEAGSFSV